METKFKCKISKLLSYPVNIKTLSEALADSKQFSCLSVSFYDVNPHKIQSPIDFMSVHYSRSRINLNSSKSAKSNGYFEPKWTIEVRPVPRVHVRLVKQKLISEGLATVKSWLIENEDANGKDGYCRLSIFYEVDSDLLLYEESRKILGRA